jgi:hypothetical protein
MENGEGGVCHFSDQHETAVGIQRRAGAGVRISLQGESGPGPGRKRNWIAGRRRAVARVLNDLGLASPEAALEDITLLSAATQVAKYEEECARFQRKG